MKPYITAFIAFLLPNKLAFIILNMMGHKIHSSARIGWSWLQCRYIEMGENTKIGHLNLIRINELVLASKASIRQFNRMKGPLDVHMESEAAIGNSNSIYRGDFPITTGTAKLALGKLAIITSKHHFDCTRSISIGNYTTISGFSCQFWSHGFYHADTGRKRIRIDGEIVIGNNVSVGSRCLFNPGVRVGDCINIGGNCCVSKSLLTPGLYVAQPLRNINNSMEAIQAKLEKDEDFKLFDVYKKAV